MVRCRSLVATASVLSLPFIEASPIRFTKRIAQVISDSTQPWVQACTAAGGGSDCNTISITAFSTLLAAPGPCEQQNAADQMIDLAKKLNNNAKMIQLAQVFAQQPRNSPDSLSVLYCQQAPKNSELNGLFQCQFEGVNTKVFTGNVALGGAGTIPFGKNAPLDPPSSCPAHLQGGIADGTQLVSITQDPGSGSSSSDTPANAASVPPAPSSSSSTDSSSSSSDSNGSASSPPTTSGDFHLQNGLDAQSLNRKFASMDLSTSCSSGDQACIGGAFAQCVNGQFVSQPCSGGLSCFALPLVNKAGTSITCDTPGDAADRITATGATGGVTGDGSSSSAGSSPASDTESTPSSNSTSHDSDCDDDDESDDGTSGSDTGNDSSSGVANAAAAPSSSGDFHLQNGLDAQKLNKKFATLSDSSSCTDGEQACIGGAFAQCVSGTFELSPCAGGTSCFALPLVNKAGTSVTCDTQGDAEARISATGATGGVTGA